MSDNLEMTTAQTVLGRSHESEAFVLDENKIELLKNTICKGATDDELQLFIHNCQRLRLDPFLRQIHAVKRWDETNNRMSMVMQTGIDGFRLISDRTRRYAPGKETLFQYDKDGNLFSATSYVKKLTDEGTWHEVPGIAYYKEYVQLKKDKTPVSMWLKMPHSQLSKCAEALAHRKAFPAEFSGLYTHEEMGQADNDNRPQMRAPQAMEIISEVQAEELTTVLDQCSPKFQAHVRQLLQKAQGGPFEIPTLPVQLYKMLNEAALKKKDEYERDTQANFEMEPTYESA